jgi:hypothetical protein
MAKKEELKLEKFGIAKIVILKEAIFILIFSQFALQFKLLVMVGGLVVIKLEIEVYMC